MIRKIKEKDITQVMTIWVKGNFKANNFIDKDYYLLKFNEMKNKFLNEYTTYVYTENGEILGFISISNNNIIAIYVKEQERRKNIGRKLVNYCRNFNKNLNVKIFEKNMAAILFFSALGFKNNEIQIDSEFKEKQYIMKWA